ncbi:hypothetical protein ABIB45_002495 [Arthrobacter sp. UYCo732]
MRRPDYVDVEMGQAREVMDRVTTAMNGKGREMMAGCYAYGSAESMRPATWPSMKWLAGNG